MQRLLRCAVPCALLFDAAHASDAENLGANLDRLAMLVPHGGGLHTSMPIDRELQARVARIGRIQVVVDDVFEDSLSLAAPYRVVNSLHISTHAATVNQQLLFREGDAFDRRVLDETARLLRDQRYLADASVEPLRYNDDNTVDVLVRVHDVWTMSPGISFGRKGGENSTKLEFEDTNFLGFGKAISLQRSQNVDRTAWRIGYVDPHVLGSWWKLAAAHSTLSDGADDRLSFGRPFYSLDSRWSAGISMQDSALTMPRYSLGKLTERFDTTTRAFGLDGGLSRGRETGWTTRYLFGIRYDARSFAPDRSPSAASAGAQERPPDRSPSAASAGAQERPADPSSPAAFIPEDRRFAYPYVGMQWIEDAYVTTRNLNQIGRTEDLHLGRSLTLTTGFASSALGSSDSALIMTAAGEAGFELGSEQYVIGDFNVSSRIDSSGPRNALLDIGGRYYRRQSAHRVFFAGIEAACSSRLDEDTQLLLGGDNGLRGYPLRYQAGTSRAVLTVEERFYTDWQPLKLANVGAAIFADTGRMWGRDPFAAAPAGWLTDVGVGLRLGSARSGLGNILHIDVAFPLDRTNDIDAVQFLIETKQSF